MLECEAEHAGMAGCMGGIYKCPVSGEEPIGAHADLFPAVICSALSLLSLILSIGRCGLQGQGGSGIPSGATPGLFGYCL